MLEQTQLPLNYLGDSAAALPYECETEFKRPGVASRLARLLRAGALGSS